MNRNILYLLFAIMALSCNPVPKEEPDPDLYAEQPAIPVYTQLLLKGDVSKVRQSVTLKLENSGNIHTTEYIYGFDTDRRLVHYSRDGEEFGSSEDLTVPCFFYNNSYAFFVFPDIWQGANEATVMYREGEYERKFDFKWDETGMFTEVRYYLNGEATAIDGALNIATRLYDANGYPCCAFGFQQSLLGESPGLSMEYAFSDFDEHGNPLKISMEYISVNNDGWNGTIDRTIEYF